MELVSNETLQSVWEAYGLYAVFCLIMLESMGVPMPGETILVIAGIYAGATRRIEIFSLIAVATAAAIIGDNIGYLLGRVVGVAWLHKYGHYIRLDEQRIKVGRYLFRHQGGKIVFLGRFVALLRVFAAVLAGASEMPWTRFLAMNALGGLCWASLVGGGAYLLGERIFDLTAPLSAVVFLIAVIAIIAAALYAKRYERSLVELADQSCADN